MSCCPLRRHLSQSRKKINYYCRHQMKEMERVLTYNVERPCAEVASSIKLYFANAYLKIPHQVRYDMVLPTISCHAVL